MLIFGNFYQEINLKDTKKELRTYVSIKKGSFSVKEANGTPAAYVPLPSIWPEISCDFFLS